MLNSEGSIYHWVSIVVILDIRIEDNQVRYNLCDVDDFKLHVRGNNTKFGAGCCRMQYLRNEEATGFARVEVCIILEIILFLAKDGSFIVVKLRLQRRKQTTVDA